MAKPDAKSRVKPRSKKKAPTKRHARERAAAYQTKRADKLHPYIEITKAEAFVRGTEIPVRAIVEAWRGGSSLETLVRQFAPLRLAEICDGLGYYDDHRAEIGESSPTSASAKSTFARDPEIARQRQLNNDAYRKMEQELKANYLGKYVVFARGQFQGAANSLEQANQLGRGAPHRIIQQIRQAPSRIRHWKTPLFKRP